jgi:hypothetical protein
VVAVPAVVVTAGAGAETAGAGVLDAEDACPDPQPPAASASPIATPSVSRRELAVRRRGIAKPDRGSDDRIRASESVDEWARLPAHPVAEPVYIARDRLRAHRGEAPVLLQEALVGFDVVQREQVVEQIQDAGHVIILARVDRGDAYLQYDEVETRSGGVHDVVLVAMG